jgi:DNA-directed RNA polymerase sigma subunit (sigma70/sigma32)
VITIAKSLGCADHADLMDLVQEGTAGLIVAIDRFDPERSSKLGAAIDLSGERVRQLERDMLARLRALVVDAPSPLDVRPAA